MAEHRGDMHLALFMNSFIGGAKRANSLREPRVRREGDAGERSISSRDETGS